MPNKLWIDDLRYPPDIYDPNCFYCSTYLPCQSHVNNDTEWEWVKTRDEAIEALQTAEYEVVSFDNDLGLGNGEGYEIVDWLEAAVFRGEAKAPKYTRVHSANPVASGRMRAVLRRFTLLE